MVATGRMARQPVRTFPPEVWDEFVAALKRGPTPEQARAVERAMEIGSKITLKDSSIVKKKRKISPAEIVRGMNAGALPHVRAASESAPHGLPPGLAPSACGPCRKPAIRKQSGR